jgi:ABC-type amino acid transport substrate-binding protein
MSDELAPLVSLGYSLPTLGQVASLIFIPFAAWYVDRPLEPASTLGMLFRAIPASVSGIKAVVRQELMQLGLPIDLLQLVYINGEWLYRFEKVLSLEGLVVLAVLVYASGVRAWTPRAYRLLIGLLALVGLGAGLGFLNRWSLNALLRDSYRNDERLLSLTSTLGSDRPLEVTAEQAIEPVNLETIKKRGTLRVGVRSDGLPWAYRNHQGRLVGFDIDLLGMLARDLGVKLEVQQATMSRLELWLQQGRLDLVAGGLQASPQRAIRFELSRGYLPVHLALVVPDEKVKFLQNGQASRLARPLVLAVRDPDIISIGFEEELGRYLGGVEDPVQVTLIPTTSKEAFFSREGQRRFDGLLTSAESGASWAVMYPRTTLVTPFSRDLSSELVLLIGGRDAAFRRYINGWVGREVARGGVERLFNYWILLKGSDKSLPRRDLGSKTG